MCGSRPWGAAAFHLCLFIWLNVLNVRRFPPPSSRIYYLHYTGCRNPGKEAGTPLPSCPHQRDRRLRRSSNRSRDSTRNTTRRWWTWGQTRSEDSVPSSRTSGRTASCSGAGWTGRFGPGRVQQPQPRPPTCRYRRWGRRMTRRRSSTYLKRPRRHVGGPKRTGLIPLLTGEAQLAAQQLPVQNLLVYEDLKRAILQRVGRSPEQHRQRFRSLELGENGRPFVMAHQLRDACRRWLLAGEGGVDYIIDQVVLEQFIARLPKRTAQWVQCHRPASLDLAIQLAEDQMVACHGVGEILPSVSLSLPSPSVSPPIFLPRSRAGVVPRAQPRWRGGPAPESTAARAHGREAGSAGPSPAAGPVSSVSPRQLLVPLPATGVAGKPGPACWRCGDPGHFIDRCPVMEVGTLVRVPDVPQAAPDQAGGYQIPVSMRGGTYWALVDSGCNQTSIHQSLVQPEALDMSCMVRVRCAHGDVAEYPVVRLAIQFRGQKHNVEVAVNPHLRHPLILGTNWPSTGGAIAGRQEAEGASGRPPKRSSTIAWHREWAAQLVEDRAAVCPETGPRVFFFSSLPSLFSVTPHPSVSFLSPRLSLPPGTPRPPWRAPPGRGGRGGVERSLGSTPRPARGDGGMWRVGRGREPWERSEAGGVNDNERHLRHSPVLSPTEELRKE